MNQSLAHSIRCFLGAPRHVHALAWPAQKPRKRQHRPTAGQDIRIIREQPPNTLQLCVMATAKNFDKPGMTTFAEGPLQGPQLQPRPSTDANSMRECASNPCFMQKHFLKGLLKKVTNAKNEKNIEKLLTNHYRNLDAATPIRFTTLSCKRQWYSANSRSSKKP